MRSEDGSETKPADDYLAYVRLRSPQQNGTALDVPAAADVDDLFASNFRLQSDYRESLANFSKIARKNVFDAAVQYTRRYLPEVDQWLSEVCSDRVVMAGHQPALFHPGVWYKNFRLDALAKHFGAVAINLVIDNDLSGSPSIACPLLNEENVASIALLSMDRPDAPVPHEQRSILDDRRFQAFGDQVTRAIDSTVNDPIIASLWPEVLTAREILGGRSMGRVLAAGRHRLEWKFGLRTLEVPIGSVAGTASFANFARQIFLDIENFREIYNGGLMQYRAEHNIRSASHPVPELTQVDQWLETPFWIWTPKHRQRRPLFLKADADHFHLSDLSQFQRAFGIQNLGPWWADEVQSNRVCIRPRALTTTIFHRLFVSDLFIHGIGGAKYDQLTDQIISDFYGVQPPGYMTSTATFSLPFSDAKVTPVDISQKRQLLREYQFHPENYVAQSPETDALKRQKLDAIEDLFKGDDKRSAHQRITKVNQQLSAMLVEQVVVTQQEISNLKSRLRNSQILHSREYSFALHSGSIVDDLKTLARL